MNNQNHVNEIADTFNQLAYGAYFYCPHCYGGRACYDDDVVTCADCGEEIEPISMWDYLNDIDIYDVEYRVSSRYDTNLNSVRICIALGGPNIYIDTATKTVDLYWWTDEAHADLSSEAVSEIESYFQDLWNCE